ncbi:MAG TPA: site-2 protease family protein [Candidatus Dormibacteraeota bacterium]
MLGDPFAFLVSCLFLIPAAVIAIPVHELGHAAAAHLMGDPTPRNRGFLRFNPRLFIETYGLLAVFLLRTGWGAPVPVNEYRLTGTGRKVAYALAGPAANLLVAVLFGVGVRVLAGMGYLPLTVSLLQGPMGYLATIVYAVFFLNLSFFAFNLLPIPGLDGWRVLEALFRHRNARFFFEANSRRREIWMVCALVIFVSSFLPLGINLLAVVMLPFYAPASFGILGQCAGYPGLNPCPLSGHF